MNRTLAVCLVVVLGGVAGATAVSPATERPEDPTRASPGDLSPGLSENGVTDPLALAKAHERTLQNVSFTISASFEYRRPNGTLIGYGSTTSRVAPDATSFYTVTTQTNRNETRRMGVAHYTMERWADENRTLTARSVPGAPPEYGDRSRTDAHVRPDSGWETLYTAFDAVDTAVVNRTERNGTTLYRVVSTSQPRPNSVYADDATYGVTALVGSDGIVRTFQLSHETTFDDRPAMVTRTIRVTEVGNTTVERPAWSDRATENATLDRP